MGSQNHLGWKGSLKVLWSNSPAMNKGTSISVPCGPCVCCLCSAPSQHCPTMPFSPWDVHFFPPEDLCIYWGFFFFCAHISTKGWEPPTLRPAALYLFTTAQTSPWAHPSLGDVPISVTSHVPGAPLAGSSIAPIWVEQYAGGSESQWQRLGGTLGRKGLRDRVPSVTVPLDVLMRKGLGLPTAR